MTVTSIMGKPLKHYAADKNTGRRYFMLVLENDTNRDECSVIDMDAMPSELRAELTEIINSEECQKAVDTYKILDTRFFMDYPRQTVLNVLRAKRWIKVLPADDVLIQLPNDEVRTPKEVMEEIRKYEAFKNKSTVAASTIKQAASEVAKVEEIERKNSQDIADLKEEVASLAGSVKDLVAALTKKK